ncbi:MAG: DNA-directed RNA polymerase subunit D [Candidatus Micrarchaeia archaeon]
MKFVLLEDTGTKAHWLVQGATPALLNALRRAILADLEAFAIDSVDMFENTSPLFNEYVANRVGLVPLTFDDSLADDAQVIFTLDAEAVDEDRTVYSSELQTQDSGVIVYARNIPIMRLGKGQILRLQGTAIKDTMEKHAKFQSAIASYGHLSDYKLSEKCSKCNAPIAVRLPKTMFAKIKEKPVQSELCYKCEDAVYAKNPEKHDNSEDFIFFVESYNNVPAARQLERAVKVLEEQLKVIE